MNTIYTPLASWELCSLPIFPTGAGKNYHHLKTCWWSYSQPKVILLSLV